MSNYAIQIYFKSISAAFNEICIQMDRLEKETEQYKFWEERFKIQEEEICNIVKTLKASEQKFIVTTEDEIKAILYYFKKYEVIDIIKIDESVIDSFPKATQFCKEFSRAYILADDVLMEKLISKYF